MLVDIIIISHRRQKLRWASWMSKMSKDNNRKQGCFQHRETVWAKVQGKKVFRGRGPALRVCRVQCVGDHENRKGWWPLEVCLKRWVSDLGSLRNQSLVKKRFPRSSARSREGVQIILDSSFIFIFIYIKDVEHSYYFLCIDTHMSLEISMYFLSLVGSLRQMISGHISN